jgi:hypothetical protein
MFQVVKTGLPDISRSGAGAPVSLVTVEMSNDNADRLMCGSPDMSDSPVIDF